MPESLLFVTPLPAYVYQNVAFEAVVKLVDGNKTTITGVAKTLAVTVRFHDSYDIVLDQSDVVDVVTPGEIDPATGIGRVSVALKTLSASLDARAFCLEVRVVESSSRVESVFSTPVKVVKEKFTIVQQPPDVWFKDEGGREKCMTVTLVLEPAPGAEIEDRVVPLDIRLLYESGTAVGAQDILRLFPALRPNMSRGRATISFRIDDVSKNHQGQSFVLEVAPETQESSLMFQDIAPVRTSAIAIRSKRNKRKLQAARPSPRSVAGTPRANLMTLAPPTAQPAPMMMMMPVTTGLGAVGPPPAQRQRRMLMHGTPTNTQYAMLSHQPGSGRAADMAMAAQQQQSVSWSSHMHHQAQQQAQTHTPMHQTTAQQQQPTPMASPTASASAAVEWKLAGFEIHPDGSQNVSCPIYRCPHCKRLHDVEAMSSGMAEHSPQCVFSRSYAVETPSDASPKTLAMMHQRLGQATISPFMNRAPTTDDSVSDDSNSQGASSNQGNLFASHAFRSHMAISEDASGLEKPETDGPESADPLGGVASNNDDDGASINDSTSSTSLATQLGMDDSAGTLSVGVGTALFHEMSSMGISLEQFDKSGGGFTPLGDFSGFGDEDQVFYILARMYTDARNRKLGLPAFDQFQRMLGFYTEAQNDAQTQVLFHALEDVGVPEKEQVDITNRFTLELQQNSDAVHSLPKYQHNLIMLREDALMYYWSQSLQTFGVN